MSLTITWPTEARPKLLSTFHLMLRDLRDSTGAIIDLSQASKVYLTLKVSPSDTDASAALQVNNIDDSSYFDLTQGVLGAADIVVPPSEMDTLHADTPYWMDVKAIWPDGTAVTLVYDVITFDPPVTRATL